LKKLKIVVITQHDHFVLPKNIRLLAESKFIDLMCCVLIDGSNTLANKSLYFVRGFGAAASIKMGFKIVNYKLSDFVFKLTKLKYFRNKQSISTLCSANKIPLLKVNDVNADDLGICLEGIAPDVIVSYSAPTVFKDRLLNLPRYGCINLHCSLIPKYCGVMPSFWALLDGQRATGCSVHTMDDRIDNGLLLGQEEVSIEEDDSMYSLIHKTKAAGGKLMLGVLSKLYEHGAFPDSIVVNESEREYFSWPKNPDFKLFRERGKNLI